MTLTEVVDLFFAGDTGIYSDGTNYLAYRIPTDGDRDSRVICLLVSKKAESEQVWNSVYLTGEMNASNWNLISST